MSMNVMLTTCVLKMISVDGRFKRKNDQLFGEESKKKILTINCKKTDHGEDQNADPNILEKLTKTKRMDDR